MLIYFYQLLCQHQDFKKLAALHQVEKFLKSTNKTAHRSFLGCAPFVFELSVQNVQYYITVIQITNVVYCEIFDFTCYSYVKYSCYGKYFYFSKTYIHNYSLN